MNVCSNQNLIINCSFVNCQSSAGALIELQGSTLIINSSYIGENASKSITSGINAMNSDLYLYNNSFYNQSGIMGGFLYVSTDSVVYIDSTRFFNGSASNSGGAINSIMSSIIITNSEFYYNFASSGGAINGVTLSNITINSCEFQENNNFYSVSVGSGSNIYFTGENLIIFNSSFFTSLVPYTDSIIFLETVTNFQFNYSVMTGRLVPGILSLYTTDISITNSKFSDLSKVFTAASFSASNMYFITNCEFYNNFGTGKGAALILSTISLLIDSSSFANNQGTNGGAIFYYCSGSCTLLIKNSKFINNTAVDGGGIFYQCTNNDCSFNISNSEFSQNSAKIGGGAINFNDTKPLITNTNFFNNSAYYANNVAGIPAVLSVSSSRRLENLVCGPGLSCSQKIKLKLLDSYENTMTLYNGYSASMTSSNENYSVSGNSKSFSTSGIFEFQNFIISGKPATYVNITISTPAIDTSMQKKVGDNLTYNSAVELLIYLRNCTTGEQTSSTACTTCSEGKYLFNPDFVCNECPYGAYCPGG